MHIIQSIVFTLILGAISYFGFKRFSRIYKNILLGKSYTPSGDGSERLKNMVLIALGQKKMFSRPIPAIFHFFIYAAFVITQIELVEIIIDGVLGQHRLFGHLLMGTAFQSIYIFLVSFIEVLSVLALVATFVFLSRRNIIKLPRLNMEELKGWPMKDANLILLGEIFLVTCIFLMNSADVALQWRGDAHYPQVGNFAVSQHISTILNIIIPKNGHDGTTLSTYLLSNNMLIIMERIGWWGHILGILGFLLYLPFSKHLHIMLAFPNAYFSRTAPKGYIANMPEITKEIKLMMNPDTAFDAPAESAEMPKFGARDVQDLTWKNLLDAYSCTECGRCTSSCPANLTGKKLSPRKIMMDTRDRLEEVGKNIEANNGTFVDDGKSLLHNYISVEELRACTTCNACVEECPVNISPLEIIVELRRNLIMEESNSPAEWNGMFGNIENNGAPWKFSQQDRANWTKELG